MVCQRGLRLCSVVSVSFFFFCLVLRETTTTQHLYPALCYVFIQLIQQCLRRKSSEIQHRTRKILHHFYFRTNFPPTSTFVYTSHLRSNYCSNNSTKQLYKDKTNRENNNSRFQVVYSGRSEISGSKIGAGQV